MRGLLGLVAVSGLSALVLSACVGAPQSGEVGAGQDQSEDLAPTGKGQNFLAEEANAVSEFQVPEQNLGAKTISYHTNGKVITGTTNIYIVWYGTWSAGDQGIITNYISNIGGSPHYNINTTYYQSIGGVKTYVSNSLALAGQTTNNYVQGKTLSDASIQTIVSSAISGGSLPKDTNGIYLVLTAPDVKESSGFCTQYCGWHTNGTISGSDIKYAFIGNPATQCIGSCAGQTGSSPNNSVGVDAMISVIQHEIEEAVTDPDLNAWYDSQGYENGDKCAWIFGTTSTAANGSKYNQTVGGKQYLVQQNWVATGTQKCASTYP
jgi:hypothetical protein